MTANDAACLGAIREQGGTADDRAVAEVMVIDRNAARRAMRRLERLGLIAIEEVSMSSRWPCLNGMPRTRLLATIRPDAEVED